MIFGPLSNIDEPLTKAATLVSYISSGLPLETAAGLAGYTSPSGARSALERYTVGSRRATPAADLAQLFARDDRALRAYPCQFSAEALALIGGFVADQRSGVSDLDASSGDSRA